MFLINRFSDSPAFAPSVSIRASELLFTLKRSISSVVLMEELLSAARKRLPYFNGTLPGQLEKAKGAAAVKWRRIENLAAVTSALSENTEGTTPAFGFGRSTVRPTITDVLTRVTASALIRHRDVNAHYVDDEIRVHPSANVGIAVAAPQGLVVPVIRGAERLTIAEIARVRGEVVQRARDNKLRQEDLQDGTFTISNLGMFGVEQFIAVLNPPQVAILAVGATKDRVVVRDGQFMAQPTMTMTLTCDHRAIDGAVGAQFLQTLAQYVEQPALAL